MQKNRGGHTGQAAQPARETHPAQQQTPPSQLPDLTHLECYKFCHDKLCSENELTNNRLSWNFTIQGFLFAAYALTLQTLGNIKIKMAEMQPGPAKVSLTDAIAVLAEINSWIPWTGILVSAFIVIGAFAAQLAILSTRKKFHEQHPYHKYENFTMHGTHFPGVTGGGNVLAHALGTVPLGIPLVFIFIWWELMRSPLK
jgi:hypothetical protein